MEGMAEVKALAGAGKTVEFGGERLEIQPLRFGEALDIIATAAPMVESLVDYAAKGAGVDEIAFFARLMAKHRAEVPRVLSIATRRDQAFIEAGDLAEAVDLCGTVYEVNRDFFDQRLAPVVAAWRERLTADRPGAGQTPSTS